jgi:hypothetical protein
MKEHEIISKLCKIGRIQYSYVTGCTPDEDGVEVTPEMALQVIEHCLGFGETEHNIANNYRMAQRDHAALVEALKDLRAAVTDAYKAGRIPAEPFVRAGNVIAKAEGRS